MNTDHHVRITPETLARHAVDSEQALDKAVEHIKQASLELGSASSYVFDQEIRILDSMFKELYKIDLLLCDIGVRRVDFILSSKSQPDRKRKE